MPTYDYRCEANQEIYEAKHPMSAKVNTWGELCKIMNIDTGSIPADSKVTKIISGGGVVNSRNLKNPDAPPCMSGGGCSGGGCGFN